MIAKASISRSNIIRSLTLLAALCMTFSLASCAHAPSFNGKWAGVDKIMDNGQPHLVIVELKQSGNDLTGTVKSLGYSLDITGKTNGNHFELFADWDKRKPFVTGELVNGELHAIAWGKDSMVAKPATAADQIPTVKFIPPPALHKVAYNGLAKTPPMGWNSWNKFEEKVDDATVREMADTMVSTGMRDAGYIYINIDDTWQGVRDADGVLPANHKFPDMKALADYVHSKGLKLGIYSSPGPATCAGYPGQLRSRGAGCENLGLLGHRLPQIRLVQRQHCL